MEEDFHMMPADSGPFRELKKKQLASLVTNGKYKLMASLYNYVHPFPTELPHFSSSPIFMLGKCYRDEGTKSKATTLEQMEFSERESGEFKRALSSSLSAIKGDSFRWQKRPKHADEFIRDFHSLLWFCYRKDFPPLEPSQLTTDIGWGCMLRTGQMMLAHMLVRHSLGRDWRLNEKDQLAPYSAYRQILRWFADTPSVNAPYSIHNLVGRSKIIDSRLGNNISKVGEWFTPTRVSQIIKHLVRRHSPEALTVYVSKDGVVYKRDVRKLCTELDLSVVESPPPSPKKGSPVSDATEESFFRPVFIMVPVRLGVEKVNRVYISGMKALLRLPQSVGFIGGRPRQSLYFVGYQDEDVFYLDPHIVRPSVRPDEECPLDTYHCSIPGKMPFDNIDPSLAVGFYCASRKDFESFCSSVEELASLPNPIITIADTAPRYESFDGGRDDLVFL